MNLDFVSAICEEFTRAIESVVPPEFLTPQDCWDPVVAVLGSNFDSVVLAKLTEDQIAQLQSAFVKNFESPSISTSHIRSALSAILRRWPVE